MLAAFRATDKQNRGYISAKDLRHILMSFGEKLSKREGKFSLTEKFLQLCKICDTLWQKETFVTC
jgi:Ca2+-binding EF-hand superfamily protein